MSQSLLPEDEVFPVLVDDYGIRPAGPKDACFYCCQKVGSPHKADCVILVRDSVYDVELDGQIAGTWTRQDPACWSDHDCHFHKNDSSWCANNFLREGKMSIGQEGMDRLAKLVMTTDCLCSHIVFIFKKRDGKIKRAGARQTATRSEPS